MACKNATDLATISSPTSSVLDIYYLLKIRENPINTKKKIRWVQNYKPLESVDLKPI